MSNSGQSDSPAAQGGRGREPEPPSNGGPGGRGRKPPSDGRGPGSKRLRPHSDGRGPGSKRLRPPSDLASLEAKIKELAKPRAMHSTKNTRVIQALHYDWTGWLAKGSEFPASTASAIQMASAKWATDGLILTDSKHSSDCIQLCFTAEPDITPVHFTALAKGRLQHAFRKQGTPVKFRRKVSMRTLGENTRATVEGYLGKQVGKEGFVDPRYEERMKEFTVETSANLTEPAETNSGRYWYNLHLVICTAGRMRMADYGLMGKVRDGCIAIARKKRCLLKSVAVMPDHVHMALRGDIEQSPLEIGLKFMNNLTYLLGNNRTWKNELYVGSFSEYGMDSIR